MHKITIIVPVYNAEIFVDRCVNSITSQTYTNFELILVNDGSTDKTGEMCDELARADTRIKVIHQNNVGVSGARNAGLRVSEGEYICFVDSDDYVHPSYVQFLYELCIKNDTTMSMCGFEQADDDSKMEHTPLTGLSTELIDPYAFIERLCTHLQVQYVVPWSKMYHKTLFTNVRYPINTLMEDDCVIHTLVLNAQKIAVSYEHLYYYYTNENSISRIGIPIESWIRSLTYKEDRMRILFDAQRFAVLYEVQRLLFYDLLIERAKLSDAPQNKKHKTFLLSYATKLYGEIVKNKAKSKQETIKMLGFLIQPSKILDYKHEQFLR